MMARSWAGAGDRKKRGLPVLTCHREFPMPGMCYWSRMLRIKTLGSAVRSKVT